MIAFDYHYGIFEFLIMSYRLAMSDSFSDL